MYKKFGGGVHCAAYVILLNRLALHFVFICKKYTKISDFVR